MSNDTHDEAADPQEQLERLSTSEDRSLAWIMREAVREYIVNRRKKADGVSS